MAAALRNQPPQSQDGSQKGTTPQTRCSPAARQADPHVGRVAEQFVISNDSDEEAMYEPEYGTQVPVPKVPRHYQ